MIEVLRLLHEMERGSPRYSRSYYVRSLDKLEPVPDIGQGIPLDSPLAQKDWIWVAYNSKDDSPVALIAAAPLQGIAFLVRAYAIKAAPKSVFVGLLRKSLADIHSRGYTKYATFLSPNRPEEFKLAQIITKAGGGEVGSQILYEGPTEIKW